MEAVEWDGDVMAGLRIVQWLVAYPQTSAALGLTAPDQPYIKVSGRIRSGSSVAQRSIELRPGDWVACEPSGIVEVLSPTEFNAIYEAV